MYDAGREISNIIAIASKEFSDNLMSKRFLLIGIFYIGMAILFTGVVTLAFYVFSDEPALRAAFKPDIVLVYMNMLNFVLALLAIIVSCDSISMERKDRTIYQLLSKPVERSSVVIGKYLGCLSIIAVLFVSSALLAYILTSVLTGIYPSADRLPNVFFAIISMVILFSVYIAAGILISTVTRNPLISIIASLLAWIGFVFSSMIGNLIGYTAVMNTISLFDDPFEYYPIYAKIMVWLDPLSHGIVEQLLDSDLVQVASGLPLWANIVILIGYTCALLLVSIAVIKYQDL
ncbi:ABC transporter permease [Methanocella sp. CWC-04]|uniref:ABC transporter permease n=1 Tax=Methanooceanicella nereidis TaxID=2052831 RepID=A0AAP2RCB8_9EURY|nr:ABC transporter permease subunit [Methanocella sp. CWC-04]MCD1293990.1 ABC transporter permease [Methanocella sp. CWC-04]